MFTIPFSKARSHLTAIVNHVNYDGKRFVITKNGQKVAALISFDDLEVLEKIEDQIDLKAAKKAFRKMKREGIISWDKAKKELEEKLSEEV